MGQPISTGSGKISHEGTLRCSIYDDTSSRNIYLVTSSAQGTYTTAFPIVSTSTLGIGTSGAGAVSYDAGSPVFTLYTTTSNDTSTNAQPFLVDSVLTGAGGYGGRSIFRTYTNVASGTNIMPLKAHMEYGDSGSTSGFSTAFCPELQMPNASVNGSYYVIECEYVAGGTSTTTQGSLGNSDAGFIYMGNSGDAAGDFDANGFLFRIGGLTDGSTNLLYRNTLKMGIGSTTWYLPLSSAQGSYTTAYPIASTSTTGYLNTATFVPDETYTNYAFACGTEATELLVTFAQSTLQNMDMMQFNIDVDSAASGTGPTGSSQMNLIHGYVTHDTDHMAYLRMKGIDMTINSDKNCKAIYAYQGEIELGATQTVTDEATVLGLVLNASGGTITAPVRGAVIAMTGASMPTTNSMGLLIYAGTDADLYDGIYIETSGGGSIHNSIRLGVEAGYTITDGIDIGGGGTFTTGIDIGTTGTIGTGINLGSNCTTGITSAAPINITYAGAAFSITSVNASATAAVAATITATDSGTTTSGRGIGLYLNCVCSGAKSSTYGWRSFRLNTQITQNVPSVQVADWYMHVIDNKTIAALDGLAIYWETFGSAIGDAQMINLGMNSNNTTTGRHCFIKCREHHTVQANSTVIRLEGLNAASYLLWLDAGSNNLFVSSSSSGSHTESIVIRDEANSRDRYIYVYDS